MDKQKLEKIARELEKARQQAANLKLADIERLAIRLGRVKRPGRGGHLTYKGPLLGSRTLIIPNHPSRAIGRGLALKLLGDLEDDLGAWEAQLENAHEGGGYDL